MSNRRTANRIRGPHSALTDFLASHNISAQDIRDDYARRVQQAQEEEGEAADEVKEEEPDDAAIEAQVEEAAKKTRKRKRDNQAAAAKIKKGKKKGKKKGGDDDDDDEYDEDLVRDMYSKKKKLPGQLENCELCEKRFTVTPYSKTGPDGGLLCTPCGKQLAKDAPAEKKAKKPAQGKRRRKLESDRLDGIITQGTKTLTQLCIEKVAAHHHDIEEFGDMPDSVLGRLSEILSKQRKLSSRMLKLFLRPDLDTIAIHDAAYLETDDYQQIFAIMPNVAKVVLRNAGQFKDESLDYMLDKAKEITWLQLYATNLITEAMWMRLFAEQGPKLKILKLDWLDASFEDDATQAIAQHCTQLERLKLRRCRRLTDTSMEAIATIKTLKHLSLHVPSEVSSEKLVTLIESIGSNLETLSLERAIDADDALLDAIHKNCYNLTKLRLSQNQYCSDAGIVALFQDWNNPPLHFIDLNSDRDMDNSNPAGPEEPIGLASEGFKALMAHSGEKLERLDIASCRHITHEAYTEVFDGVKIYPNLMDMNISFCNSADTVVAAGMFKSCPSLRKLTAFGCFNIEDPVVPAGVVLIGVPRAQEAIEQFGDAGKTGAQALIDTLVDVQEKKRARKGKGKAVVVEEDEDDEMSED